MNTNLRRLMLIVGFPVTMAAAFVAGGLAQGPATARGQPESWRWSDTLDAVNAAPWNHKVLFENDHVRLLDSVELKLVAEPVSCQAAGTCEFLGCGWV